MIAAHGAVTIAQPSRAQAVAAVSARLRGAGMRVVAANPRTGMVVARSSGAGLVDCGTFTQSARGNVTRFPAHAARAAIFDPSQQGQLVLREVSVRSQVTVQVGSAAPFAASSEASHEVRVSQKPVAAPAKGWRQDIRFGKGVSAPFPDGVICVDNGRLADMIGGT
jgi:hypothetical protein